VPSGLDLLSKRSRLPGIRHDQPVGLIMLPIDTRDRLAQAELTYREAGRTAGTLPAGYHRLTQRVPIGHGQQLLTDAGNAVLRWQVQIRAGLEVSVSSPVAARGAVVILGLGLGLLRLDAPCCWRTRRSSSVLWSRTSSGPHATSHDRRPIRDPRVTRAHSTRRPSSQAGAKEGSTAAANTAACAADARRNLGTIMERSPRQQPRMDSAGRFAHSYRSEGRCTGRSLNSSVFGSGLTVIQSAP
jgi:Domain of unknown function (DUF1990)